MRAVNPFINNAIRKETKQQKQPPPTINLTPSLSASSSNQITQNFSFKLQQKPDANDPTLAWSYNVPILNQNQKFLFLVTQTFTTILQDYIGDNFPQTISIGLRNFSGFIGFNGIQTNKVIVMNLVMINTSTQNGLTKRDLIYKNQLPVSWPLGLLRTLAFEVYVDEETTPISFPVQNGIPIMFRVIHVAI